MASSSTRTQIMKYHVFPSFHGPDVRRKFLSHLYYHFASKGITTFKDQEIKRGRTIGPELKQAIRESRISIVVLSKNYASSSWCLDELVEILKCKEAWGQIVMTIFYDVDPSNVRKQIGDFGRAFEKTCERKTEEEKLRWSKALTDVANIAGEHSLNWDEEAAMVERIARVVSNRLNGTTSRDFEDMVGLQAHVTKVNTLLCLEYDEVKMIGIWGPAGIGKTTIARALFNQLSTDFQFKCFMGNLKGNYKSIGVDDYDSKFYLQNQLLSKILNQNDVRIHHLGAVKEWLQDKRVLIVIDDVDDLEQLEALAKEPSWFGSGSRVIVTSKDKKIMKAPWASIYYHVDYPSGKEALEILCMSAFKQRSPWKGFEEVAVKVAKLCGNLPLCLSVVGSSLRGESKHEWKLQLNRLGTNLDRKIEDVLKVAYEKLSKKEQVLFLHIACFFNTAHINKVTTLLADSNLDVRNGLKILADKYLVHITVGCMVMHPLVQQLGRHIVLEQSDEPEKRQFLIEAKEICDVLANETGTGSVIGISFDMSKINEFSISGRAFEGMRNLRFLRIYRKPFSKEVTLRIQEDMKYLPRLRLLLWESFPRKRLPSTFRLECLIALIMPNSKLEKLWRGIEPLASLRKVDLSFSDKLKEIPNLSNATNLEILTLQYCTSLVELPSSISNLHKLKTLMMLGCKRLKVVPTNINLASLEKVNMYQCSQLRMFPDISRNIKYLYLGNTKIKEVPPSIVENWLHLEEFFMDGRRLKKLTSVPPNVTLLDLSYTEIERIPDCVIELSGLRTLRVQYCRKLVSLPDLSRSLEYLYANNCGSLERVCSFHDPVKLLMFHNCLKLDEEARREIIQQRVERFVLLPGKKVPAEFTHKAEKNSITIPLPAVGEETFSMSLRYKACLVLSPVEEGNPNFEITCRLISRGLITRGGVLVNKFRHRVVIHSQAKIQTEHLFIYYDDLFQENTCLDVIASKILLEFSCGGNYNIVECGVQILMKEAESRCSSKVDYFETIGNSNHSTAREGDYGAEAVKFSQDENNKSRWGWLRKFGLWKKKRTEVAL
ncbi:unnamed protein product [Arabis nemorensis]|uniref:ADP-ribosyl cyclase/cyclic ADP-ribose hydrolase n=1 Tax=Arabis nemorensis TaxID=586526 RepID=A0A565C7C3_9BRAS|nr:unnamed protein product [Arabis nemorensis]